MEADLLRMQKLALIEQTMLEGVCRQCQKPLPSERDLKYFCSDECFTLKVMDERQLALRARCTVED